MLDKQLSIPGLPIPEPKEKKPTAEERLASLESRMLKLELEVSLLRILMEKGDKWKDLTDSGRTIPACRLNGVVHKTQRAGLYRTRFETYCGKPISQGDLLIMMQRPKDITCTECRRHERVRL